MRLTEEQLFAGLVHAEAFVRIAALRHFDNVRSQESSVFTKCSEAIELYGWREALTLEHAVGLPVSEGALVWILRQARTEWPDGNDDEWMHHREMLARIVAAADVELLERRWADLNVLIEEESTEGRQVRERIRLRHVSAEECWDELYAWCRRERAAQYIDRADTQLGRWIVEALATKPDVSAERVLELIDMDAARDSSEFGEWMIGWAVELAGRMRLEEAIPSIVSTLVGDPDEWIGPACVEALERIGGAQVVDAVRAHWGQGGESFQVDACCILGRVRSERCAQTCLELFACERDRVIKELLGQALAAQYDTQAIEPLREWLADVRKDPETDCVRHDLAVLCELGGVLLPELDA